LKQCDLAQALIKPERVVLSIWVGLGLSTTSTPIVATNTTAFLKGMDFIIERVLPQFWVQFVRLSQSNLVFGDCFKASMNSTTSG
jgi:hypothetical protein